jgi:acyl-CoA reductase-like NAD-dependent aldehyde dehydrogenase
MATTTDAHKLLLDGAWIETRESIEVRSVYSGDVVGRVAKAGAGEARRAGGAAAPGRRSHQPAQGHSGTLAHTSGFALPSM